MKRKSFLLALILIFALCACALGESPDSVLLSLSSLENGVSVRLSGPTEMENMAALMESAGISSEMIENVNAISIKTITVPSLSELIAAVTGGRADVGTLTASTAKFVQQQNPDMKVQYYPTKALNYSMLLRAEDKELLSDLNLAISYLVGIGIVDQLFDADVRHFSGEGNVKIEGIEPIEGADTIYVGICGDLPPMDYTTADGIPAGFNVHMMQLVSKFLQKNVEFVVVPNEAKYQALISEKIDVFFWHVGLAELPDAIAATVPYAYDTIAAIYIK